MMPVWISSSPNITERGTSSDAPNVSSATTAKPSTFERSNDGTSTGDTTSAASTRPSDTSSGTTSLPRGMQSMAARKRRSASSRSRTWRNCSCSRIEPNIHLSAGSEALTVVANDHEAVGARRRRQQRRAGNGERLDHPVHYLHAGVIEAADWRADLAAQCAARRAVRPRLTPSTECAYRAAGKEIVGAQARHRIAGEQDDEAIPDASLCAYDFFAGRAIRAL